MQLNNFYKIEPDQWMFKDHPDVKSQIKKYKKNPNVDDNEEFVRQWILAELIKNYNYPSEWLSERIFIEDQIRMGSASKEVDISLKNSNFKPFLLIETKKRSSSLKEFDNDILQLHSYLAATHTASIGVITNGKKTLVFQKKIDPNEFNQLPDFPEYNSPKENNKNVLFRDVKKIEKSKNKTGLKLLSNDYANILVDCHNFIRDIDGFHDDEALDELSKIIFTKIFDESSACRSNQNAIFNFQTYNTGNPEELASQIRDLYDKAKKYEIEAYSQRVLGYSRSRGVFQSQIKLSSNAIYKIVETLQEYSFIDTENVDVKGNAFQKVLGKAIRSGMGQYFTPDPIVNLIVNMCDPSPSDLIMDPFCGSGHFLSKSLDFILKKHSKTLPAKDIFEIKFNRLHGIEKSDRMVRIAMTDMMLHDDGHTNIRCTDSLLSFDNYPDIKALSKDKKKSCEVFDKIFTNPPFGSIIQGEIGNIIQRFKIASGRKTLPLEYLGIERCIQFLKPNGILAIVLPDGLLTNLDAQFARDWITDNSEIHAVISLPIEAFGQYGTFTKTSVMILKKKSKNHVERNHKIFMANISDVGYDSTGRKSSSSDIKEVIENYKKFKKNNNVKFETENCYTISSDKVKSRFDFKGNYFTELKNSVKIEKYLDVVFETKNIGTYGTEVFPYISVSELEKDPFYIKKKNIKLVESEKLLGAKNILKGGDILFARLGPSMENKKSILVDPEVETAYCSNEFHVLRPKEGIPSEYILYLIKSEAFIAQSVALARGATPSRFRLGRKDLPNIKIPIHKKDEMIKFGKNYFDARKKAAELKKEGEQLINKNSPKF